MAFLQQSKPLGTSKILCEALKLPTKNTTLILPILLSSFLSSSILFISAYILIRPVTTDLTSNAIAFASADPNTPEGTSIRAAILNDLKQLIGIEAVFIVISFIVSSLIAITTIHAFCLTICTGKLSTHEDLLRRLRGGGVKGPLITKLYVKLLGLGYLFLIVSLASVFFLIARGSAILIAFGVVVALLGLLLYLYLVLVWSVSVVVSVAEGCYGLDAISKAGEAMRGRRRQGVVLVVIEVLVIGMLSGFHKLAQAHVSSCTTAQIAVGLVYVVGCVLVSLFECAVSTVFYLDCKKIDGEEGITIIDGAFMYGSVPTAASDKV